MSDWLNRVTLALPRNGTTSHTINPSNATGGGTVVDGAAFTPTAGRFLAITIEGGVTSTTPTSWTLPTGGSAVNNTGLYFWYRASAAGSDVVTTTHNGSNYPVVVTIFEFPAGTSFVKAAAATGVALAGANPSITALTGTNWLGATKAVSVGSNVISYTSASWAGTPNPVELSDTGVAWSTTDGYGYTVAEANASTATSWAPTATLTGSSLPASCEAITFALTVPAGSNPGTLAASTPKLTGVITGTQTNPGSIVAQTPLATGSASAVQVNPVTLAASVPVVRAFAAGVSVNQAALSAAVPLVAASLSGSAANAGALVASVPMLTASVSEVVVNRADLSASVPRAVASIAGSAVNAGVLGAPVPLLVASVSEAGSANVGVLNASLPRLAGSAAGASVNAGVLLAGTPRTVASLAGTMTNPGGAVAKVPPLTGALTAVQVNSALLACTVPLLRFAVDNGLKRNITVTVGGPYPNPLLVTLTGSPISVSEPSRNPIRVSGGTRWPISLVTAVSTSIGRSPVSLTITAPWKSWWVGSGGR